ncbi:hypothetical protein B0I00_0351 [Novosphingobium kunmingense]|uniref:Elongation factor P n=1 Tax=Novosphingobium kunmingense TaxID=1211806 RepID=A0A2N0I1W3_9SPHN|nr:hypothetical protein [Novosphingobium kunmingense]PKB25161.1 hypothetical protein B0I00_0351 [Novosphingobium kunmingense]
MIRTLAIAAIVFAAAPASAVPGGKLGTLEAGSYACELPGDAAGPAGIRQPDEAFEIVNANTYRTAAGRGTYLLTGETVTMTSGPKKGTRYHRISGRFLRMIGPDGKDSALRCVRRVVNNG